MKNKYLFLAFIIFYSQQIVSEETKTDIYSIQNLIEISFEKSDLLKSKEKQIASIQYKKKQVSAWDNPSINLDLGKKKEGSGSGEAYNASFVQSIYSPIKRKLAKTLYDYEIKSDEISFSKIKLDIYCNVIYLIFAYNEALEHSNHLEERKNRLHIIEKYLSNRPFPSSQKIVEKNLIRLRLNLLEKEISIIQLKHKKYWENLNFYLKMNEPITPYVSWFVSGIELDYEKILNDTFSSNPSLLNSDVLIQKKIIETKISRRKNIPDLNITGYVNQERAEQLQTMVGGGLTLQIPVWNRNRGEIQSLNQEKQSLEYNKNYLLSKLESDSKELWLDYNNKKEIIQKYPLSTLENLHKQMDFAEKEFRKGNVNILSFLELENTVSQMHSMVYESQVEYVASYISILQLTGQMNFLEENNKE